MAEHSERPNKPWQKIVVPKPILRKTIDAFREAGNRNMECFALWLADQSKKKGSIKISELYIPYQYSSTFGGRVIIGGEELNKLNRYLYTNGLQIVSQIHSHPEEAFHSSVDNDECIATTEGSYSIVVPFFGRITYHDISKFGVFRLEKGRWEELTRSEINNAFEIRS